jgi:protein-glutamine gamma-glutamyltransferase
MKTSQALNLFTHLLALVGFFAISITGQVNSIGISVFLISLILSFINERFKKGYYLSQKVITALAIILVIYVFTGVVLLGTGIFDEILIFLVYTQVLKLLGPKGMRDVIQIYILSFFQFLAGTVLTVDFSYGVAFVVYVALALWAIIAFNMKKESIEASSDDDPKVITPLFLGITGGASFVIFIFTALIFISVPRLGSGFLTTDFIKPHALSSGFSDEVRLGQVGRIKLDQSPVMRIRIVNRDPHTLPRPIYWRGIALDEFDGTVWRTDNFDRNVYIKNREGIIKVKEESKNKAVYQEVVTEPIDTHVLFAGSVPVAFKAVEWERIESVNDSYMLPNKISYRLKYTAYSDLSVPSNNELRKDSGDYHPSIKKHYLQLPNLSSRIDELARKITFSDRDIYDKAESIKRYLIDNMNYTLTLENGTVGFPLEDFLFKNKAGHCEYFATAMVVLLREVGVPARIVNGFLGGEWNEYGRFFLVRESNAHSWVEVLFPHHGWVLFDPTPSADEGLSSKGEFTFVASYLDYLKYRWSRYVVDFGQKDQIHILSQIQDNWRWQKSRMQNKVDFNLKVNRKWGILAMLVVLVAWIFLSKPEAKLLFRYVKKGRDEKASIMYREALVLLSKRGFKKADFVAPKEFANNVVCDGGQDFRAFGEFTEKYLDLRFGDRGIKSNYEELERLLDKLKREIK